MADSSRLRLRDIHLQRTVRFLSPPRASKQSAVYDELLSSLEMRYLSLKLTGTFDLLRGMWKYKQLASRWHIVRTLAGRKWQIGCWSVSLHLWRSFIHVSYILYQVDLMAFALNGEGPSSIVLISGDKDYCCKCNV